MVNTTPETNSFLRGVLLAIVALAVLVPCSLAQPASTPQQSRDPLMTLMLSQPKLDTTSPVQADAYFDPPQVRPGQPVVYRLALNALKDAVSWSGELPQVRGLVFRPGASGEIMQIVGTNMRPRTAYNFHSVPERAGLYVVPEFSIRAYGVDVKIPSAVLHVTSAATPAAGQKLLLDVSPREPYVGEAVRVRILSPAPSGVVQALSQVQLHGHGFMQETTANRQAIETEMLNGRPVPHYIYETVLTPILPGRSEVFAQGFASGSLFSGSLVITGPATLSAVSQHTLLDSDPVRLLFRPLPAGGRLPGFSGAVGDYSIATAQPSTNVVRVGEPLKLSVTIRGRGNLGRLSLPQPPGFTDWQVLEPKPEQLPPQVLMSKGAVVFTYTMIPLHAGVQATPELPFSYFHPDREQYISDNIKPVPVKVIANPGRAPADLAKILRQRERNTKAKKEPVLGPMATTPGVTASTLTPLQLRTWFPAVQIAPAVLFGGLLLWERRRRYLEMHPEVVLRKKALHALRTHRKRMRNQTRWGNEPGFADSAVAALQVITAPHYPATPGAVTRNQVLAVLGSDAPARSAEIISQLFEFSNVRRFSDTTLHLKPEVLPLLSEVEVVLDYLKERSSILVKPSRTRPRSALPTFTALAIAALIGMHAMDAGAADNNSRAFFEGGLTAMRGGEYGIAAELFRDAARMSPSAGALRNLGNAEWQRGKTGHAIHAWEQAAWLDPFDSVTRDNLAFARKTAQVDSPNLEWHEVVSSYLPSSWWAWLAGGSLWLAAGAVVLPVVLRLRKSAWHQVLAALGLAGFLLTLPAHLGIASRARMGVILERDTPLRLTPTADAQPRTSLAPGDPVRLEGRRGDFLLVSTSRSRGWVHVAEFGPLCPETVLREGTRRAQ